MKYILFLMMLPFAEAEVALDHLKQFEGLRLEAYGDYGRYSIGYGSKSFKGEVITKDEANRRLVRDYLKWYNYLDEYDLDHWTQSTLAAVLYNIGTPKGKLKAAIKSKCPYRIAAVLSLYCNAGGERKIGLVKRRAKDIHILLNKDCYQI